MSDRSQTCSTAELEKLCVSLESRSASIGIVGIGYVGLPLALTASGAGFAAKCFDIDAERVALVNEGRSPINTVPNHAVHTAISSGQLEASGELARLSEVDVIVICVPTPLDIHRTPDLSHVVSAVRTIRNVLRAGQLVVLESTTWPGTTSEVVKPILEESGLKLGVDFLLAYSPEREDPGNADFGTSSIPRVVGADDDISLRTAKAFYGAIVEKVVPVASTRTAEAVKLTENIYRSVNIALVNELKLIFSKMGINVWEVIEAAKTKPFGYQAFYPGPGLGGHCIPVDPFYLSWKAREFGAAARFIELAGEVNADAPKEVISVLIHALGSVSYRSLAGSRILLMGIAYKRNVDDVRESPATRIYHDLMAAGAHVDFYDPLIPVVPKLHEVGSMALRRSISWDRTVLSQFDAALICTDHDAVDYQELADILPIIVDTRNVMKTVGAGSCSIFLA